ncbi:MAG: hypothetical protein AAB427_12010 [Chloroflexota bacterium]
MTPALVRDVMTIGVPVCRDTETCGAVAARMGGKTSHVSQNCDACVALDEDGMALAYITEKNHPSLTMPSLL